MRTGLTLSFLVALLMPASPAIGYDFTWTGWYGPEGSLPIWGNWWSPGDNALKNGWGETWWYWEDPVPHFPGSTSSVLIPEGVMVIGGTSGGILNQCGDLTLATGAVLDNAYSNLVIYGPSLQNDGTLLLTGGGGSLGGLEVNGPLVVGGEGEILLAPGRFLTWSPPLVLTIGSGQYIHGDGQFGSLPYGNYHGVQLTNHGHIQATSTTAPLDIFGLDVANDGTVEATGGAALRLYGDWDNAAGEIVATSGGVAWLANDTAHPARVRSGTLRTSAGGEIRPEGGGVGIRDITIDGTFHILRWYSTHMAGTITNLGTINNGAEGGGGPATIQVDTALTFAGTGSLLMGDGNLLHMYDWPARNDRVTNGSEHTIDSYGGQFGAAPDYYGDRRIEILNEGTFRVFNSANPTAFRLAGAGFENRGELIFEPAASVNAGLWGEFLQTAGRTVVNDGFIAYEGSFAFTGGVLTGGGYLQGAVEVGGSAAVHPGSESAAGTLYVNGPLAFADGATLVSQWSESAEDLLRVNGLFAGSGTDTVRVEFLGEGPATPTDYVVLRADDHADAATWVLQLPAGWGSDGLAWVGHDLVVKGLSNATGVAAGGAPAPASFRAAPNPFNPSTTIHYTNPREGAVRLWVCDVQGRLVRALRSGHQAGGEFEASWDGRTDAGTAVGSGAYFAVLETARGREAIRLTLVR